MKILDRHFGARTLGALLKTTLALVMLFILIDILITRRSQIVKYEVPWNIVVALYAVSIPQILYRYQIGALAMLVSGLLVFGEAAERNEVTAALAGGISLGRLSRVPILVAAGLAVALFLMQDTLGAAANRRLEDLNLRYFSSKSQAERKGISWTNLSGGWTCHIMKFNRIAMTGEDVFLHSRGAAGVEQIEAGRIYWNPDARQWILENGWRATADPQVEWNSLIARITQQPAPFTESPEELFALENPPDTKSVRELWADIRRGQRHGMPVNARWADLYAKFSQPALCFTMIWLAIPFAMRIRRGGFAIGIGVSVAIGLAYLILFQISMGLGHIDRLPPFIAAWLANIVFLAFGVLLFRRTAT